LRSFAYINGEKSKDALFGNYKLRNVAACVYVAMPNLQMCGQEVFLKHIFGKRICCQFRVHN